MKKVVTRHTSHVTHEVISDAELEEEGQGREGVLWGAQRVVVHVELREAGEGLPTRDGA